TYTAREKNAVSGEMYFRYRTYSPTQGQFLSRDPFAYIDGSSPYAGYFGKMLGVDQWGLLGGSMSNVPGSEWLEGEIENALRQIKDFVLLPKRKHCGNMEKLIGQFVGGSNGSRAWKK